MLARPFDRSLENVSPAMVKPSQRFVVRSSKSALMFAGSPPNAAPTISNSGAYVGWSSVAWIIGEFLI